jgi:hypothetical protein
MSSKVRKYIGMVREYCIAISSANNILIAISATINILYCNIFGQQYIDCNICDHQYIVLQYLRQSIYCIAILSNHNILYCEQYIAIYCQYNIFLPNLVPTFKTVRRLLFSSVDDAKKAIKHLTTLQNRSLIAGIKFFKHFTNQHSPKNVATGQSTHVVKEHVRVSRGVLMSVVDLMFLRCFYHVSHIPVRRGAGQRQVA